MPVLNYFPILENFTTWLVGLEQDLISYFDILIADFRKIDIPNVNHIPGLIMKSSLVLGVNHGVLNNVVDFAEYLEINLSGFRYEIRRLSDSLIYQGGSKSLKIITQAMIQKSKGYNILIQEVTSKFDDYEKNRIDEAYSCLIEQCYFSCVVSSVVALEWRLLHVLKKENEPFLLNQNKDLRFTLGELIRVYLDNKSHFNNIIPNKYDKLLILSNSFRIISAHAKEETVNKQDAKGVFNLIISFLLDDRCFP